MDFTKRNETTSIWNIFNQVEEYWINSDGIIIATNLEAVNHSGYEEVEIIGRHFSLLYPPTSNQLILAENDFQQLLATGEVKKKMEISKKDKTLFQAKIQMICESHSTEGLKIKLTIQDQVFEKTKVKRLKTHFDSLFHNHFIGVIHIQQKDLKIILANVKACEMLGDHNVVGKSFGQFLTSFMMNDEFMDKLESDIDTDFEIQLVRADGSTCWANLNYSVFVVDSIIELLLYDITEDKKRLVELEKINTQLDQFIKHLSHDLRSPIASILGLLDLSKHDTTTFSQLKVYIDLMLDRTLYLDNILLDLTTIALNEKTPLELTPILFELELEPLLSYYRENNPHIEFKITIDQSFKFVTDLKRLKLILKHLLTNAEKYQNPSEKKQFIRILVDVGEEVARIEIEDNGIGIQPNQINRIYDMFFKATEMSSGAGLGLYIVKSALTKLDGTINVLSSPVCGSIFCLTIPNRNITTHNNQRGGMKYGGPTLL